MLSKHLYLLLNKVKVSAFRLLLKTPDVFASTPMIRGVWGRALNNLDKNLYSLVFVGETADGQSLPRYIIRPAPYDPDTAPALDWILFNVNQNHEKMLWRAWDIACGMGLGKDRSPFLIREIIVISPSNTDQKRSWTLAEIGWPLTGDPSSNPCVLQANVPLRLIKKSQLIDAPNYTDLIVASVRRISGLAGLNRGDEYASMIRAVRKESQQIVANKWIGEKCNLVRWSATQQNEVELFGVTGSIFLPDGPGNLWPLLSAAQWSHLGKGTVYGMGELHIEPFLGA
ncbi:MAG: CRISPR system precrRNA processing endoribonuclease RAMP protein Cas6 [Bacteroidetes bacterium]|nr:CRISPR system precrRNA processing endoribonuclease RAMP protein Cas6 [Bacteroidota bacterium]